MADKTFLDSIGVAQLLSELKTKINDTFAKKTEITDFVKSGVLNNYKTSAATTQEIEQAKNDIIGKASDDTAANTIYALKKKLQEKANDEGNATQEWVTKQIDNFTEIQIVEFPTNFIIGTNQTYAINDETWVSILSKMQDKNYFNIIKINNNYGYLINSDINGITFLIPFGTENILLQCLITYTTTNIEITFQQLTYQTILDKKIQELITEFQTQLTTFSQNVQDGFAQVLTKELTSPNGTIYTVSINNEGELITTKKDG